MRTSQGAPRAYVKHKNPFGISPHHILEKLVALNKQRALEEKAGKIKWLRPDYQILRVGSDAERARLDDERRSSRAADKLRPRPGALDLTDDLREMLPRPTDDRDDDAKPRYPTSNELAETAAVMRVLATSSPPQAARS